MHPCILFFFFGIPSFLSIQGIGNFHPADFVGDGNLGDVLARLLAMDNRRHGPPPASRREVEKLADIQVTPHVLATLKTKDCSVCQEDFAIDDTVNVLPCLHPTHKDCLRPWLDLHNTCPVCRFELPTDDEAYERMKARRQQQQQQQQQ